jgi:hypothetical protein
MEFGLPNGWTLRLTYYAAGDYDTERGLVKAGDVDAEFIPSTMRERHLTAPKRPAPSIAEGRP